MMKNLRKDILKHGVQRDKEREMKDGKVIMAHRDNAKGDPDAPLSPKEMKEKAVMLFNHAGIEEPLKWIEKILCIHKDNSSFSENELYQLLDLKA